MSDPFYETETDADVINLKDHEKFYSPDKVFPGTKRDKTRSRISFDSSLVEEVMTMIARKELPEQIGTFHQFARDAVVHRLHFWREQTKDPQIQARIDAIIARDSANHMAELYEDYERTIEQRKALMQKAIEHGDREYLLQQLRLCKMEYDNMLVPHLKERFRQMCQDFYRRAERL